MLMRIGAAVLVFCLAQGAVAGESVPQSPLDMKLSFAPVVRAAAPAVVNIYAKRLVASQSSPFAGDPFFQDFFRQFSRPTARLQNSLGSGVIVDGSGIVVSNFHVVGDATDIRVVLHDRREFDGEVMLADEAADLAFIRLVGARGLPALELADSDAAQVGDLVLAIGNPFGVGQTVTSGIVSALARGGGHGQAGYLVQTDAAINPGNSGGALVDTSARLLGINTSILTRSGGSNGIGFAIPSNLVAAYLQQARAGADHFVAPWSGLRLQAIDSDLAQALGQSVPQGVMVADVHPQSPFAIAGVRTGDVLLEVDGAPVFAPADVDFRLALFSPGQHVGITLMRDHEERTADVTITQAPDLPPADPRRIGGRSPFAGLEVANVNPRVAQSMNLPYGAQGVVVTGGGDAARRLGLRVADILREVNGQVVVDTRTLEAIAARAGQDLRLRILREGRDISIRLIP